MKQKVKKIVRNKTNDEKLLERISLLKEYVSEHDGKFPNSKEGTLGKWLYDQQRSLKEGKLSKKRKELLDSLGNWTISYSNEDRWNDRFKELQKFVYENQKFPMQSESHIGEWLHVQKLSVKKGKLSKERKELLDSLGDWISCSYVDRWNDRYKELQEFVNRNNRFPTQNEGTIGRWLYDQKLLLKNDKLKLERKELLDSLGDWSVILTHEDKWNIHYKELQEFVYINNRFPTSDENNIGYWLTRQRRNFKNNLLTKEQINMLDSLGDWKDFYKNHRKKENLDFYDDMYNNVTCKKLTNKQMNEKFKLYRKTNDQSIRNELIICNMDIVLRVLHNLEIHEFQQDLLQTGYMELIHLVDSYDSDKCPFATFAYSHIEKSIKKELCLLLGTNYSNYELYDTIKKVENEYCETILENPSLARVVVDELVSLCKIDPKFYDETIRAILMIRYKSLNELMDRQENSNFYNLGYVFDDNSLNNGYDEELKSIVNKRISLLNERKQELLELYYGLNGKDVHTVREISDIYGISHQAVSQKINSILNSFSKDEAVQGLKYYLHR